MTRGSTDTFTVAGKASLPGSSLNSVTVSGTGLSSGAANKYADGSWARTGATLADGNNSYTATATDFNSPTPPGRAGQRDGELAVDDEFPV